LEGQLELVMKKECDLGVLYNEYSRSLRNLLGSMLERDKTKRPTCSDILKSEVVVKFLSIVFMIR